MSSLPAVPATQHRITLRGVSVVDDLDTGDGGGGGGGGGVVMVIAIPVVFGKLTHTCQ